MQSRATAPRNHRPRRPPTPRQPHQKLRQNRKRKLFRRKKFRRNDEAMRKSMMLSIPLRSVLVAAAFAILIGGCSAISGLNPFNRKEEILPGERRAVLQQDGDAVVGGTPSIGAATDIGDWSQPGGNAANAPGNVSLAGISGASAWRTGAVDKASKRN